MAVLLSLVAALCYGTSDFVGGLVSRRTSPWPVAALTGAGGFGGATVLALALPGHPAYGDLAWGALAGVGSGAGGGFLYRGLAAGRMGVVAPVSAVGAALLPVVAGLIGGERPGGLVWVGVALAFPGIWLVSREPSPVADSSGAPDLSDASDASRVSGRAPGGVGDGLLAGLGFGLLFVAIGQVPAAAGFWPLAASQGTGLVVVVVIALALGHSPVPTRASELGGLVAGVLASAAVLCFLLATQTGLLTVAAVVTSLYPAFTVLLAALALHERIHRTQGVGLALSAVAVALVAGG